MTQPGSPGSPGGPGGPGNKVQKGTATLLALWLAIVGCMLVWIGAQRAVDRQRSRWPVAYPLLFLPNGNYLSAASLGFQVLLADMHRVCDVEVEPAASKFTPE